MIQIQKMIRDAAAAVWDVRPMAVTVVEGRRGSGYVAQAKYAGREIEARGTTVEKAQYALVTKLHRRLTRRVVKQMRVLSRHRGQRLPHRFDELPVPLSDAQYEQLWSKLRSYNKRSKPSGTGEHAVAAA